MPMDSPSPDLTTRSVLASAQLSLLTHHALVLGLSAFQLLMPDEWKVSVVSAMESAKMTSQLPNIQHLLLQLSTGLFTPMRSAMTSFAKIPQLVTPHSVKCSIFAPMLILRSTRQSVTQLTVMMDQSQRRLMIES